jgi:hypothetical protein
MVCFIKMQKLINQFSKTVPYKGMTREILNRRFATYKTSTGLAGLAVDPEALTTVANLSSEVLERVKVTISRMRVLAFNLTQKIPADSEYRKNVEQWFTFIHKTVTNTNDVSF